MAGSIPLLRTPFILFNYDSTFRRHSNILAREDVRILHLIRDPRDVLISAMHYHKTADEAWLHQTVPGGGDVPYQRKLNSFATPFEQYLFEMENASSSTIEDMLDWRYDRPNCLEIRYEDLRVDHSMALWSQILAFLGFDESEQKPARNASGITACSAEPPARIADTSAPATSRSGNGSSRPKLAQAFVYRFPDALQALGYEPDDQWIEQLGEVAEAE